MVKGLIAINLGFIPVFIIKYLIVKLSKTDMIRYLLSVMLHKLSRTYSLKTETLRSQFTDTPPIQIAPAKNHTHPGAAANRSEASMFIDSFAARVGRPAYFIQSSRADLRNNRNGSRTWYWVKDTQVDPRPLAPPDDALLAMVDVDHYVDMPTLLARHFQPTIIYTFQPEQTARVSDEYSYTFDDQARVVYRVSGGAHYQHHVWNYSVDNLLAVEKWFGIPIRASSYLIDRRRAADDHEVIMCTPLNTWGWQTAWLATLLAGSTLERLNPIHGAFARLQIHKKGGVYTSTSRVSGYAVAVVPSSVDDTLAGIARISKLELTNPQVQSYVNDDREASVVLTEYHRLKTPNKPPVVFPIEESVRRYQFSPADYDPDAKPTLRPFMNPFLHECFAPDHTKRNEEQCVRARIEDIRCDKPMTSFDFRLMDEFLHIMIPEPHQLNPTDDDELYENQSNPRQRRILDAAQFEAPDRRISLMLKKEAYAKVNDPRPISMFNGVDKGEYSKFMYALAAIFKTQRWYAFGKTPLEIARTVAQIASKAKNLGLTDFSRMDGRIAPVARDLELMLLMRAFHQKHHSKILDLHRAQYNLLGFAPLGTAFFQGTSRGSGSPETSQFNTFLSAFAAYKTKRMTRRNGAFLSPNEAYSELGLYGGDDGFTPDVNIETYKRAAMSLGQEMTGEVVYRGQPGVKFLARYYSPNVWFDDPTSICDLPRTLSKFHSTVALAPKVTPLMKLHEKARSLYLTDANTPIVGPFTGRVLALVSAPNPEDVRDVTPWGAQYEESVQYPNDVADWAPGFIATTWPELDLTVFNKWISTADTPDKLLAPPLLQEPKPATSKTPVVVDGIIIGSSAPQPRRDEKNATNYPQATKPRNNKYWRQRKQSGDTAASHTITAAKPSHQPGGAAVKK